MLLECSEFNVQLMKVMHSSYETSSLLSPFIAKNIARFTQAYTRYHLKSICMSLLKAHVSNNSNKPTLSLFIAI